MNEIRTWPPVRGMCTVGPDVYWFTNNVRTSQTLGLRRKIKETIKFPDTYTRDSFSHPYEAAGLPFEYGWVLGSRGDDIPKKEGVVWGRARCAHLGGEVETFVHGSTLLL